jgi:phosphohistidine phosphatase SixA
MLVRVVRHAHAGHKGDWPGDDAERPLDARGEREAVALGQLLAGEAVHRLRSSPTRRCVDTLAPLADVRRLDVERLLALSLEAPPDELARLLTVDARDGDVVCAHGEAMANVLGQLRAAGVSMEPDLDDDALLDKGTCWELTVEDGRVHRLRHVQPLRV